MSAEESKILNPGFLEGIFVNENLAAGSFETPEKKVFRLALAIATEPSKLGQLRQMLVHFQEQRSLPEEFSSWALGRIDERIRSLALEYAHDAEAIVQILSFKGGTFDSLMHTIEEMYQHEQISQRVYVRAKLLLRT